MSETEAQEMIEAWYKRFTEAGKFLLQCDKDAKEGNVLITPFGRKRRFGLVSPMTIDNLQRQARNFPVQSTASDLTLLSGITMQPTLVEKFNCSIVNIVHDSVTIELDDDPTLINEVAHYAAEIMKRVPREKLNAEVVFEVDAEVGSPWGELEPYNL